MKHSTIALLTLAAVNAVKLRETTYDETEFTVRNIKTSQYGQKVSVTFDAPTTTISPVQSYVVNFKGPSLDKELECSQSPCVFNASDIGELDAQAKYQVLMKPIFATSISWGGGFDDNVLGTFETGVIVDFPLVANESRFMKSDDNCQNGMLKSDETSPYNWIGRDELNQTLRAFSQVNEWTSDEQWARALEALQRTPVCPYDFEDEAWQGHGGIPIISVAARYGQTAIVEELIKQGADVNTPKPQHYQQQNWQDGMTPIMFAVTWHGNWETAKVLVDAGADLDVTLPKSWNENALYIAALNQKSDSVKGLVEAGADCTINQRGDNMYSKNVYSATAMFDTELAQMLLDCGAPEQPQYPDCYPNCNRR